MKDRFYLFRMTSVLGLLLSVIVMGPTALASQQIDKSLQGVVQRYPGNVWRLDMTDEEHKEHGQKDSYLPRNYRAMPEVRMSGSGQPSALRAIGIIFKLRKDYKVEPKDIYIVDLRQESHGLIVTRQQTTFQSFGPSTDAISLYGKYNWGNVGKSKKEILKEEKMLLQNLYQEHKAEKAPMSIYKLDKNKVPYVDYSANIRYAFTVGNEIEAWSAKPQDGPKYVRFTCTDHLWPQADQIDDFLEFYKKLPPKAWLHFHCQAGVGRTTSFMVMYDILHNGKHDSLEKIVERQHKLGGQDLLHLTNNKEPWRIAANEDKVKKVKMFYEYVQTNPKLDITWSKYLAKRAE